MPLYACQNEIPSLLSCPPAGSKVLLFDVTGAVQYKGMALMDIDLFKCCIINQMFGAGSLTIKGSDLTSGLYYNSNFVQSLLIYAWNIPNQLIREGQNGLDPSLGQWRYVLDSNGKVVGVDIYGVGYGDDDLFTISPNPTCTGTPAGAFPEGINTIISGTGVDVYTLDYTPTLRQKYGEYPSLQMLVDDGSGVYQPSGILGIPNQVPNPTSFELSGIGNANFILIIS